MYIYVYMLAIIFYLRNIIICIVIEKKKSIVGRQIFENFHYYKLTEKTTRFELNIDVDVKYVCIFIVKI